MNQSGIQVKFGFGFAADWLRRRHVFCCPIIERSKAKQNKREITFDTQLKTALIGQ